MDPPFVDEHAQDVAASPDRAWDALVRVVPRAFGGARAERFARMVGCEVTRTQGEFPQVGSAVVGFRVAASEAPRLLRLEGRHRYARYALTFRLDPTPAGTRVRAETRAAFPGFAGQVYRAGVIGTRMHVVVVRRLLRAVDRRAGRS